MEINSISIPIFDKNYTFPFWILYSIYFFIFIGLVLVIVGVIYLKDKPSFKKKELFKGIYKYTRNPIYTGLILSLFSYSIYNLSFLRFLISILFAIVIYFKTLNEEKQLSKDYPNFNTYKKVTGMFFPKFKRKN